MRIFIVSSGTNLDFIYNPEYVLCSYAYPEKLKKILQKNKEGLKFTFMLDSGAFTVWNKQGTINLNDYIAKIKYIQDNYNFVEFIYANLDVIPSKPNVTPTIGDIEKSAQEGWNNYRYMKEHGLNPIHIFHQNEDFKWLKKMVDAGETYIGISPRNDVSTKARIQWLDRVYKYLPGNIRTHGYAVTSPVILDRYPWYSVDSASWMIAGGHGIVHTVYGSLIVSERSSTKKTLFKLLDHDYRFYIDYLLRLTNSYDKFELPQEEQALINALKTHVKTRFSLNLINVFEQRKIYGNKDLFKYQPKQMTFLED